MRYLCLALLFLSGASLAQTNSTELPNNTNRLDAPELIESRRASLVRLLPYLEYSRVAVNQSDCVEKAVELQKSLPYQMFLLRTPAQPALMPLEPFFGIRELVDKSRLATLCATTVEIGVAKFKPSIWVDMKTKPQLEKDYYISLVMSEWAQVRASGTESSMADIPTQVSLDPFSSLGNIAKIPSASPPPQPVDADKK